MLSKRLSSLYDLWNNDSETTGKSKSKLHPSAKRTAKKPLPHPGQSYNPDPEDHQKLLRKIAQDETKYQRKQQNIAKATKVKVNANELRKHEREELVSGIKHLIQEPDTSTKDRKNKSKNSSPANKSPAINVDDSDGSSTDSAYSDYDEKDFEAILRVKKVEERRKTKKQRLAQLKDKLQRKAAKLRKAKNLRSSKFDALKKITKELDKKEREAALKQRKKHRKLKDQRLGPKFEQSDPIYCLSNELPSSLRAASCPMNAIVREQLESFQSRLMVEPSHFQIKKRRYKKRAFERTAAGDNDISDLVASDIE